jgi:hypothetical protein
MLILTGQSNRGTGSNGETRVIRQGSIGRVLLFEQDAIKYRAVINFRHESG